MKKLEELSEIFFTVIEVYDLHLSLECKYTKDYDIKYIFVTEYGSKICPKLIIDRNDNYEFRYNFSEDYDISKCITITNEILRLINYSGVKNKNISVNSKHDILKEIMVNYLK